MKRIVLMILVLTAVYGLANCQSFMYGQQKSSSMPWVGLCGGLNVCTVTGTEDSQVGGIDGDFYPVMGINGGFMLYLPLPVSDNMLKNIILQGELKINTKGSTYAYTANLVDEWGYYLGEADVNITHIYGFVEVPMMAKYNLSMMGTGLQPYFGASVGYLLFGEESWTVTGDNVDESDSESIKKYMNDLDFTAIVGCDLLLGKSLMVGARYSHSLTKVFKESNMLWQDATNQCLSVNAGIMFNLF